MIKLNLSFSLPKTKKEENWKVRDKLQQHQYRTVFKSNLLGCGLDENLSGDAIALKVINKINSRLPFLYRKNRYLLPYLKRLTMQCNNSTTFP